MGSLKLEKIPRKQINIQPFFNHYSCLLRVRERVRACEPKFCSFSVDFSRQQTVPTCWPTSCFFRQFMPFLSPKSIFFAKLYIVIQSDLLRRSPSGNENMTSLQRWRKFDIFFDQYEAVFYTRLCMFASEKTHRSIF